MNKGGPISKLYIFCYAGCDAAFIGPNDDQFVFLDEDKTGLSMYILPKLTTMEENEKNLLSEENQTKEANASAIQGPQQFLFETEVDRVFSTPIGVASDILILKNLLINGCVPSLTDSSFDYRVHSDVCL